MVAKGIGPAAPARVDIVVKGSCLAGEVQGKGSEDAPLVSRLAPDLYLRKTWEITSK